MSLNEFELIERYFTRAVTDPDVVLGIGDDAAVVDVSGRIVVATDSLVAGVHFPDEIAGDALGYRVLAVNLSDLAAMGAQPRWCTLALTLPKVDDAWLEQFANGFFELANHFEVSLIGGDLSRGPMSATVQLIGVEGTGLLTRSGGHVGDDIYVTGSLGDSAGAVAILNERSVRDNSAATALTERFYRPEPRVAEGLILAPLASAAIDISDGLLADLGHLCTASSCGAVIDTEHVPQSAELLELFPPQLALAYALSGGDDYELCFTASPVLADQIEQAMEVLGTGVRRIGELVSGRDVVCRRDGELFTSPGTGYAHF